MSDADKLTQAIRDLTAENGKIRVDQKHEKEFIEHRISSLECCHEDHEQRIRLLTSEVAAYKTRATLVSVGAAVVSLLALLRAFLV